MANESVDVGQFEINDFKGSKWQNLGAIVGLNICGTPVGLAHRVISSSVATFKCSMKFLKAFNKNYLYPLITIYIQLFTTIILKIIFIWNIFSKIKVILIKSLIWAILCSRQLNQTV